MFAKIKFTVTVQKVTIHGFFNPPSPISHHNNLGHKIYHFVFLFLSIFEIISSNDQLKCPKVRPFTAILLNITIAYCDGQVLVWESHWQVVIN